MFHRAETVNHPYNLAQQSQFCGISTALQTDILGHVSSGCIGEYMLAGPGGQAGHIRGAKTSEERARALINIAAPEFKDELIENYVLRFKKEFS